VVLVDDVRTTGATLDACARVLKRAGAREVRALTLALADPPGRPLDGVQRSSG
jgi:predicted amidophosphoribosyltransferase